MNNNEKIKKIEKFVEFYNEEFGNEKDFLMTMAYKIAQLKGIDDEDDEIYRDLKEL